MNATLERAEQTDDELKLEESWSPNYWTSPSWIKEQLLTPGGLCLLALLILCLGFAIFGGAKMNGFFANGDRVTAGPSPFGNSSKLIAAPASNPSTKISTTLMNTSTQPGLPNSSEPSSFVPAPLLNQPVSSVTSQPQHPSVYTIAEPGTAEPRLKTIVNQ